jgi:hypothetical protein
MAEGNIEYKKWKVPAYLLSMLVLFAYFLAMMVAVSIIPLGPFNKPEFLISTIDSSQTERITLANGVDFVLAAFENGVPRDIVALSVKVGTAHDPSYFKGRSNTYKEEVISNQRLLNELAEGNGKVIAEI